jgi:polyhydroxyalkanoate synthase subunit PhaC
MQSRPVAGIATGVDWILRRPAADLRPMPATVIHTARDCIVRCFETTTGRTDRPLPVLLVPPLGVSGDCFDLRRGGSLVEYLLAGGHPVYVVDYGAIRIGERSIGLDDLVDRVLPCAVEVVSEKQGGPVQLVGWCLGGMLALLVAANGAAPVRSVSMIASPFEGSAMAFAGWLRRAAEMGDGDGALRVATAAGAVPAPIVRFAFRLVALDRYVTRPLTVAANLTDREFLAQMEAVDAHVARMRGYPGRALAQVHRALFSSRGIVTGVIELNGRRIRLADVRIPVLSVAASRDRFAPPGSVYRVAQLLPNAPEVTLRVVPGGHLGALSGRHARATTWRFLDDFLTRHGSVALTPAHAS